MSVDRKRYLDESEVKALRNATENKCIADLKRGNKTGVIQWMLVDLALSTGLRVSEMAAIRLKDLHLKRRYITITRLKRKRPVSESLGIDPKLIRHLREFIGWKKDCDQPMKKGSPLFIGQRGELTATGLAQAWKSAVRRARLDESFSVHSARHTLATHLLRKTKNLRQVQKQLGHSSPVTTANMYADVSFDDMVDGVTGLYA